MTAESAPQTGPAGELQPQPTKKWLSALNNGQVCNQLSEKQRKEKLLTLE